MTNYWLRTNKGWNFDDKDFELWDTKQTRAYDPGDKLIFYVTNGPGQYYLVGIYEYEGNRKVKPLIYLPESRWLSRPPIEEWRELLKESLELNTPFDIEKTSWVGRISSEGLLLTEGDFNRLKDMIVERCEE